MGRAQEHFDGGFVGHAFGMGNQDGGMLTKTRVVGVNVPGVHTSSSRSFLVLIDRRIERLVFRTIVRSNVSWARFGTKMRLAWASVNGGGLRYEASSRSIRRRASRTTSL